jgi:transcriptional regulator with XRE-family HTH domain
MAKANKMIRLEQWLTENDVTYEDLAKRLDVTSPAIFHYIKGRNRPSAEMLVRLSEITGISCADLLANDGAKKKTVSPASDNPVAA